MGVVIHVCNSTDCKVKVQNLLQIQNQYMLSCEFNGNLERTVRHYLKCNLRLV